MNFTIIKNVMLRIFWKRMRFKQTVLLILSIAYSLMVMETLLRQIHKTKALLDA